MNGLLKHDTQRVAQINVFGMERRQKCFNLVATHSGTKMDLSSFYSFINFSSDINLNKYTAKSTLASVILLRPLYGHFFFMISPPNV